MTNKSFKENLEELLKTDPRLIDDQNELNAIFKRVG